ncbi:MAG TPA: cation diffusion facilitator family transporter [Nitrospirota bacterium]
MVRLSQVRRVLLLTLGLNIMVSGLKLGAGYWSGSLAMVADGFHSFFDASSNILGLIGIQVASRPPDSSHPYGHKKFETFATVGVAVLLFMTCIEVLKRVYGQLTGVGSPAEVSAAGFAVMFITVGVNIFVSRYETRKGREYASDFLLADAGHTRSDIMASASVIAGLAAVKMGYPAADPVVALVIALLIARVGIRIIKTSSDVLCDAAVICPGVVEIICMSVPGVIRCHHVRSRGREDEVLMDLHIHVAPNLTTNEAHAIAHKVENAIRAKMPGVADIVVHIEPEEQV